MEKLGEKFKQARLAKKVTIDQASEETCIQKTYLEALESEQYENLPADHCVRGFIRSYAQYLGLKIEDAEMLYRSHQIQEQPVPMTELLSPTRKKNLNLKAMGVGIGGVFGVALLIFMGYHIVTREKAIEIPEEESIVEAKVFDTQFMEQKMKEGENYQFNVNNNQYFLTIKEITDKVVLEYQEGLEKDLVKMEMVNEEEQRLDFDKNGIYDITVSVRRIETEEKAAYLRFDREVGESISVQSPEVKKDEPQRSVFMDIPEEPVPVQSGIRRVDQVVVKTSSVANPFSIDIVFRQRCFVRYKLDTEDEVIEGFYRGNQRLRLDGNMKIYLSLSNAGVASVKVDGIDVQLGKLGQLVSREVQWAYNQQKRIYELRIIPRY